MPCQNFDNQPRNFLNDNFQILRGNDSPNSSNYVINLFHVLINEQHLRNAHILVRRYLNRINDFASNSDRTWRTRDYQIAIYQMHNTGRLSFSPSFMAERRTLGMSPFFLTIDEAVNWLRNLYVFMHATFNQHVNYGDFDAFQFPWEGYPSIARLWYMIQSMFRNDDRSDIYGLMITVRGSTGHYVEHIPTLRLSRRNLALTLT